MNPRLAEIDKIVDSYFPNDKLNEVLNTYQHELGDYDYIDTVEKFSLLRLCGKMRYISKYDKKLRTGGLLVKIFQQNGKWTGIIKQYNKKYYVSFDNNYIFYIDSKAGLLKKWANIFVTDVEKGLYDVE